jgi:hypothetical protein
LEVKEWRSVPPLMRVKGELMDLQGRKMEVKGPFPEVVRSIHEDKGTLAKVRDQLIRACSINCVITT